MPMHLNQLLAVGLAVSLLGAPILLLTVKRAGGNQLGLATRLALWVLAAVVCWIAESASERGSQLLGLRVPGWPTVLGAAASTFAVLAVWPLFQYFQGRVGGISTTENSAFLRIAAFPLTYRLFLVATAAVTEEILYRGYAVGIGGVLLDNLWKAAALSIIIFTATHFRWGLSHMLLVLWAALALTSLFVITHDLLACIVAHGAIDTVGLVLAPFAKARRNSTLGPVEH
jgi:membrane protease YdiL (CAAX protease family)